MRFILLLLLLLLLAISPCFADVYFYGTGLSNIRGSNTSVLIGDTYEPQSNFIYYFATEGDGNGFLHAGDLVITNYIGNSANVNIPPTIDGNPVKAVSSAFKDRGFITNIVINTLPAYEPFVMTYDAFTRCTNLLSVTLPQSTRKIGQASFYGTAISNTFVLPSRLEYLQQACFQSTAIKKIVMSDIVSNIEGQVFYDMPLLEEINISTSVVYIGLSAFDGNFRSKITNLVIPASLITVVTGAFRNNPILTNITCKAPFLTGKWSNLAFSYNTNLVSISLAQGSEVLPQAFVRNCTKLGTITIPSTVTNILANAFLTCTAMTNVFFEGMTAPNLTSGTSTFSTTDAGCIIYYHSGATGYTNPWGGRPTATY